MHRVGALRRGEQRNWVGNSLLEVVVLQKVIVLHKLIVLHKVIVLQT